MRIVMIEPDIMVDKRGPLEFWVLLDCKERDWVFEDRGVRAGGSLRPEMEFFLYLRSL